MEKAEFTHLLAMIRCMFISHSTENVQKGLNALMKSERHQLIKVLQTALSLTNEVDLASKVFGITESTLLSWKNCSIELESTSVYQFIVIIRKYFGAEAPLSLATSQSLPMTESKAKIS